MGSVKKANMLSSYALILSVNFGSQINLKLNLSIDLYWQSSCGKPLDDSVPLKEISWAVIINRSIAIFKFAEMTSYPVLTLQNETK